MKPGYCEGWEGTPALSYIPSTRVILMDAVKFYTHYVSEHKTFIGHFKIERFWNVSVILPIKNQSRILILSCH